MSDINNISLLFLNQEAAKGNQYHINGLDWEKMIVARSKKLSGDDFELVRCLSDDDHFAVCL